MAQSTSGKRMHGRSTAANVTDAGSVADEQDIADQASADADLAAQARLQAAEQRDASADTRDVAALARDQAAAARDIAAAQAGSVDARPDGALGPTAAEIDRVATHTGQPAAEQRRSGASEHRVLAAEDRLMASRDREQAAADRRRSLVDRELLVAQLRREHEQRDAALEHQRRAEQLARTLQRSLSPPSLPQIPGLDVAVHYEPSAPEEVGGDFYDLFPLTAHRSGFFLGDVCGKGPEAAAITSLVRYTMRTAAMLHERPAAILSDLNAALLIHADAEMKLSSAVYGQIDLSPEAGIVTLAAAGHPPPLIVRTDGSVQIAATHGTILGAVDDPRFHTCQIELGLGDAIVIYSDGTLDIELGAGRITEQRLAELLTGFTYARAEELVDRLTSAFQDAERPLRDDVAIMTLRRTPLTPLAGHSDSESVAQRDAAGVSRATRGAPGRMADIRSDASLANCGVPPVSREL